MVKEMGPDFDEAGMAGSRRTVDLAQLDDKHLSQYRHPAERWSLLAIIIGAAILLLVLWAVRPYFGNNLEFLPGPILQLIIKWTHPTRIGLVILVALFATWAFDMLGQTAKAWQLVARAVEITPSTFPDLAPIVDELRGRFDLPRTRTYVSREAPPAGYTIGVREPYAIVMSATTVGSLKPDEFRFLLGREMGHIKLRHTWAATVLGSASMHLPVPLSYLLKLRAPLFGSYQHAQELSCDRIGVVATRDVTPALSALIKQNLGSVQGSQIDIESLAPQAEALRRGLSGASLRLMHRMSAQPFAVSRLLELIEWAGLPEKIPAVVGLDVPAAIDQPPALSKTGAAAA
jgi:Zn-dependent protease with chaperone function